MEKHCVSLRVAKLINKAGWKKETEFWWVKLTKEGSFIGICGDGLQLNRHVEIFGDDKTYLKYKYPAPLATEILADLPNKIGATTLSIIKKDDGTYVAQYCAEDHHIIKSFGDKNLSNALASMWIWWQLVLERSKRPSWPGFRGM